MTDTTINDLTPDSVNTQAQKTLSTILTSADSSRASTVQNLGLIQQARLSRLNRAATAATAQYGAGSKQAAAAQAAVSATQATVSQMKLVNQQITTPAPPVSANGWALHGRVYDSNLNALSGYSVFLVDGQKNYQSTYGFAYTDSSGYFLINYPGASPARASTGGAPAAGAPTGGTTPPATGAGSTPPATGTGTMPPASGTGSQTQPAASAPQASSGIFLQVADTQANPVFLSTSAFQPSTGNATYQVVTVPAGKAILGDPPAQIRAVALPPKKS
jgi:hypothetical protein